MKKLSREDMRNLKGGEDTEDAEAGDVGTFCCCVDADCADRDGMKKHCGSNGKCSWTSVS